MSPSKTEKARSGPCARCRLFRESVLLIALSFSLIPALFVRGLLPIASAQERNRPATNEPAGANAIDLQGHRGARGLLPENSVPSVLKALDFGVKTVELDVVVTRDRHVVVSHEPWMSSIICRTPDGDPVTQDAERSFNLYEMDYDRVAGFDCGSRGHPDFPDQRPTAVSKPLLRDLLRISEGYALVTGRSAPHYNVEIKSAPGQDEVFHPDPNTFARLVYDVLAGEDVLDRTTIQSFDTRPLTAMRALDPSLTLALLVSNEEGLEANLAQLGFTPDVYSPHHRLVDDALMEASRAAQVDVVPWTVNDREEMMRLLHLGVDGLITDYPDEGREVVQSYLRSSPDR